MMVGRLLGGETLGRVQGSGVVGYGGAGGQLGRVRGGMEQWGEMERRGTLGR